MLLTGCGGVEGEAAGQEPGRWTGYIDIYTTHHGHKMETGGLDALISSPCSEIQITEKNKKRISKFHLQPAVYSRTLGQLPCEAKACMENVLGLRKGVGNHGV